MKSNLEITISDIKDSKIRTIPDQISNLEITISDIKDSKIRNIPDP